MKRLRRLLLVLIILAVCVFGVLCASPTFRQLLWGPKYHGVPQLTWQEEFRKKHDPQYKVATHWLQKIVERFLPKSKDLPWEDLEDEDRAEILIPLFDDPCTKVRLAAVQILPRVNRVTTGGTSFFLVPAESLVGLLTDPVLEIRQATLQHLSNRLSDPEIPFIALLEARLLDDDGIHNLANNLMQEPARLHQDEVEAALLAQLTVEDSGKISRALHGVEWWGARLPGLRDRLLHLLDSPDVAIRKNAITALLRFGEQSPEYRRRLITLLHDDERGIRELAADAFSPLKDLGDQEWAFLLTLARDADPNIRRTGVRAAFNVCTRVAELPVELAEAWKDDDEGVRMEFASAMRRMLDDDIAERGLTEVLLDPSPKVRSDVVASGISHRSFSAENLQRIMAGARPRLWKLPRDERSERITTLLSIGGYNSLEVPEVIDILESENESYSLPILRFLALRPAAARKHATKIEKLLASPSPTQRFHAAQALYLAGNIRGDLAAKIQNIRLSGSLMDITNAVSHTPEYRPPTDDDFLFLGKLIDLPAPPVAFMAFYALRKLATRDSRAGALLAKNCDNPCYVIENPDRTACGLAPISDEAFRGLKALLLEKNAKVRRHAIDLMSGFSDRRKESLPLILAAIDDENAEVRMTAITAIGGFEDAGTKAVNKLLELVRGKRANERAAAYRSLAELKEHAAEASEELRGKLRSRYAIDRGGAAVVLGNVADVASIPELTRLLDDPQVSVRCAAAEAFRIFGEAGIKAAPKLNSMVVSGSTYEQFAAAKGLSAMKEAAKPAVDHAIRLLGSPDDRFVGLNLLSTLADAASAAQSILVQMNEIEYSARFEACCAVGVPFEELWENLRNMRREGNRSWYCLELANLCAAYGPKAEAAASELIDLLNEVGLKHEWHAHQGVIALGKMAPDHPGAVPLVRNFLKQGALPPYVSGELHRQINRILKGGEGRK